VKPSGKLLYGIGPLLLVGILWEVGARTGSLPVLYTSSPGEIIAAAARMLRSGEMLRHLRVSATEAALGLGLAIAVGLPLGLAAGWFRRLRYVLDPYLAALNATPSITLIPLFVLWLGMGTRATSALVFTAAVIPITMSAMHGVRGADATLLKMARSFDAGQLRTLRVVVLPGTVPFLVGGLRLAVVRALVALVLGEMYAAPQGGIGSILTFSSASLSTDRMFVAVGLIMITGVASIGGIDAVEHRLQHWKPRPRE
jgi:NitT/TauT family transport system permease protein